MQFWVLEHWTWVHNTQGSQHTGSRIFSGGYLFGVSILACCQHINSLTAVLIINRCPQPVLGHHPILVIHTIWTLIMPESSLSKLSVWTVSASNSCLMYQHQTHRPRATHVDRRNTSMKYFTETWFLKPTNTKVMNGCWYFALSLTTHIWLSHSGHSGVSWTDGQTLLT